MINKLVPSLIWVAIVLVVLSTGYNVYAKYDHNTGSEPYVIDMLKIDAAQRLKVSKILGEATTSGDYYDAFKASGSVMAAAREVSGGRPVAIKQAFLIHDYVDITDRVIEVMDLPNPGDDFKVPERLLPEAKDSGKPSAKLEDAVSNNRDVGLPY